MSLRHVIDPALVDVRILIDDRYRVVYGIIVQLGLCIIVHQVKG